MAFTPPKPVSPQELAVFLTRLKWKASTGEFEDMAQFRVDCYLFQFDPPLTGNDQYGFIEYTQTLNLAREWSVVKLAIWLYQHNLQFTLTFQWNTGIPFWFNVTRMRRPAVISKMLKENMDTVLSCDLAESP